MKLKKKITWFLNRDIRSKLKTISKLLRINLYPKNFNFKKKNLSYLYKKFIFNLIFYEKVFVAKKNLEKKIFDRQNYLSKKSRCFTSPPGSGSTFIRNVFNSYFEIKFGIGNGIPKFNNTTNIWVFSGSPWLTPDLYNSISDVLQSQYKLEEKNTDKRQYHSEFYSEKQFFKKAILFSRYPYKDSNIDLYDFNKMKFLVLFRDPYDWMISQYIRYEIKYKINNSQINKDFINRYLLNLQKYLIFWNSFTNKKKNILFINYKNITKNNFITFKRILTFFNYDTTDKKLIQNCIKYNSVNFSKKLIKNFKGTRFTDIKKKKKIAVKISKFLKYEISRLEIDKLYKQISNKVNI